MKNHSLSATCVLLVAVLHACSPIYYEASPLHAPMLAKQHDARIAFTVNNGTLENSTTIGETDRGARRLLTYNLQAAYSPVNYLGLTGSYFSKDHTGGDLHHKNHIIEMGGIDGHSLHPNPYGRFETHARYFDVAIGGYYPFFNGVNDKMLMADFYMGYGNGITSNEVTIRHTNFYMQPGINFRINNNFELSTGLRVTKTAFTDVDYRFQSIEYLNYRNLSNLQGSSVVFFDPAVTFKGGYRFVKAFAQFTISAASKRYDFIHYKQGAFWLGVHVEIDNLIAELSK